ncbi:4-hydroxythreonine-4-phosphate dehydrogenase PdxA [uncultured Bradyrhizobium sp.]|uniref:4-hydroxythreonine-4-phosphate dehydrogenase PdxA n=1 Tax=uncultured Bradyrhizobium sp. TaxID=199684 RepID=UPI00260675C6|nr:4-hydroxythreonine-4-phosphate dehydrogenase PdxA [uncultured Bradyrhizobium sp.]
MLELRKDLFADERDDNLKEIGKGTQRQDMLGHVTGTSPYFDDHKLQGMLHLKVVRSAHPHARLRRIDTTEAERSQGVRRVIRASDVPRNLNTLLSLINFGKDDEPSLAVDKVRYKGEPIVAIVADSPREAYEATLGIDDINERRRQGAAHHRAVDGQGAPPLGRPGLLLDDDLGAAHAARQSRAVVYPVAVVAVRHRPPVRLGIEVVHRHHLPGLDADPHAAGPAPGRRLRSSCRRAGSAQPSAGRKPSARPEPGRAGAPLSARPAQRRPDRVQMTPAVAPLVLTLGEPAGVGPEIVAAAWKALRAEPTPFAVIGDAALLRAQGIPVAEVGAPGDAGGLFGSALPVIHRPLPAPVLVGSPDPANASAVADGIEEAVSFALSGEASGVVTAPIAKAPMYASGFRFPGHTEFIAELTADAPYAGTRGPVMMLTAQNLRACLVTIHVPIDQLPELVTGERVARVARVVGSAGVGGRRGVGARGRRWCARRCSCPGRPGPPGRRGRCTRNPWT